MTQLTEREEATVVAAPSLTELENNIDRLIQIAESHSTGPQTETPSDRVDLSFVIPVMNEEATIEKLCQGIAENVPDEMSFEIILIDDGSNDRSWEVIESLSTATPDLVRGLRFRSNAGKAAGLSAGFRATRGNIVFTMDADLQDDPTEIPAFLQKLDEGYDLVSGWKKSRHDPWHKVFPSRIFNWMTSHVTGVRLHDHNCGFKCYRGELARELTLHGELHRMVPAIAGQRGYRVTEMEVRHHPREHGVSKYGFERFLRGFSDMLTIGFMRRFSQRPAHFINSIGFFYLTVSTLFGVGSFVIGWGTTAGIGTLLCAITMAAIAGAVFVGGLISELMIRGGLPATWRLPIDQDTTFAGRRATEVPTNRLVPTRYVN